MTKKRRRKQSDSDYRGADCDDLAKLVHGHKKPPNNVHKCKSEVAKPNTPAKVAKKQNNLDDIQVEEKPLQVIFKQGKSRKRLVYFKYPDELSLIKTSDQETVKLNQLLEEFLRKNPEYQVKESKRKKRSHGKNNRPPPPPSKIGNNVDQEVKIDAEETRPPEEEEEEVAQSKEDKSSDGRHHQPQLIKNFLIFGLNQVFRLTQSDRLAMILLLDPLTTHLQNTLLHIATQHNTPVLMMPCLDHIADMFRVSTAACVGIMKCAGQDDSPLKTFYDEIFRLYHEIRGRQTATCSQSDGVISQEMFTKNEKKVQNDDKQVKRVDTKSIHPKRIQFHMPCPEYMYILKKPVPFKQSTLTTSTTNSLSNGELGLFASVSSSKDDYFPRRPILSNVSFT